MGKKIRHIKIRSLDEIDADHFVDLLRQNLDYFRAGEPTPRRG